MIRISMTSRGTVVLTPSTKGDRGLLRSIGYLRSRRDGVSVAYWTYLRKILRDIPAHSRSLSAGLKPILSVITERARSAKTRHGIDEVAGWFRDGERPYGFQGRSISFALEMERVLIADATGLGKSISSLGAVLGAFSSGTAERALFIVPAGLKYQWFDEIAKFARPDLVSPGVKIINGTKKKRKRIYGSDWKILITSPGLVVRDAEYLERKVKNIDAVVLDEASCILNRESATSKTIKRVFASNRYKIALTATPIENRLLDLFSIFEWVDKRVFGDAEYFNARYAVFGNRTFTVKKKTRSGIRKFRIKKKVVVRYKNLKDIPPLMKPCYIRRSVSDVGLELPALVCNWEVVRLSKKERDVYAECISGDEESETLKDEARNSWLQGVRQACNATTLVSKTVNAPSSKIRRLKELLETDLFGEQVIVFTDYERYARIIANALPMKVALFTGGNKNSRETSMQSFKDGERRVLIATSAGERGHNLQTASVIVNIDLPFNPARLKQRIGRIMRINSPHDTVRMVNFIAEDTIEETIIRNAIYTKRKLDETVIGKGEIAMADPIRNLTTDLSKLESGEY